MEVLTPVQNAQFFDLTMIQPYFEVLNLSEGEQTPNRTTERQSQIGSEQRQAPILIDERQSRKGKMVVVTQDRRVPITTESRRASIMTEDMDLPF